MFVLWLQSLRTFIGHNHSAPYGFIFFALPELRFEFVIMLRRFLATVVLAGLITPPGSTAIRKLYDGGRLFCLKQCLSGTEVE